MDPWYFSLMSSIAAAKSSAYVAHVPSHFDERPRHHFDGGGSLQILTVKSEAGFDRFDEGPGRGSHFDLLSLHAYVYLRLHSPKNTHSGGHIFAFLCPYP